MRATIESEKDIQTPPRKTKKTPSRKTKKTITSK